MDYPVQDPALSEALHEDCVKLANIMEIRILEQCSAADSYKATIGSYLARINSGEASEEETRSLKQEIEQLRLAVSHVLSVSDAIECKLWRFVAERTLARKTRSRIAYITMMENLANEFGVALSSKALKEELQPTNIPTNLPPRPQNQEEKKEKDDNDKDDEESSMKELYQPPQHENFIKRAWNSFFHRSYQLLPGKKVKQE